jgi:hypothetical protein
MKWFLGLVVIILFGCSRNKEELIAVAQLGGYDYDTSCQYIHMVVTVTNYTNEEKKIKSTSCGIDYVWIVSDSLLKIDLHHHCYSNGLVIIKINPGEKCTFFLKLIAAKQLNIENRKLRIGIKLTKAEVGQILLEDEKTEDILWTQNEIDLGEISAHISPFSPRLP